MNWFNALMIAVVGVLGSGNALLLKRMSRGEDRAATRKTDAESESLEVATLKAVIVEIKESRAEDKGAIRELTRRVSTLEERERHNLIRSAVHEAWDQMAFQMLLSQNPSYPPPPPLTNLKELQESEDRYAAEFKRGQARSEETI